MSEKKADEAQQKPGEKQLRDRAEKKRRKQQPSPISSYWRTFKTPETAMMYGFRKLRSPLSYCSTSLIISFQTAAHCSLQVLLICRLTGTGSRGATVGEIDVLTSWVLMQLILRPAIDPPGRLAGSGESSERHDHMMSIRLENWS